MVFNSAGSSLLLASVDETADITVSGAGGLDTGTETSAGWYHIWIIYNGSSTDALLSVSASSPTLPGGYTHYAYVGAVYNIDSDFIRFWQRGALVQRQEVIVISSAGDTSQTVFSLSAAVPSTALTAMLNVQVLDTGAGACIGTLSPSNSGTIAPFRVYGAGSTANGAPVEFVMATAQTGYYNVNSSTNRITAHCAGWRF